MNTSEWSELELIELHRSFLEMRRLASASERLKASFQILLHRASMVRLETAAIDCRSCPADLMADVLQEAILQLVELFSAESLSYTDRGVNEFGSWYWTVCYNACGLAAKRLRGKASRLIVFVDTKLLAEVTASPETPDDACDKLSYAIAHLPEGRIKNAILDWLAGLTVNESARRRGTPPRTVDWLRRCGRGLMLELCDTDAIDGE